MVIAKSPDSSVHDLTSRYLDVDKINNSLDKVATNGATYAEVRLVAYTDYSVSMRDGKIERAIPGQEIGATIRVLADGAWGVHSTTDIASLFRTTDESNFEVGKVRCCKTFIKR